MTVEPPVAAERPLGRALLFLVALALLTRVDWGASPLGRALPVVPGWLLSLLIGVTIAGALVLQVTLLRRLPFKVQVGIVWAELAGLFALFFWSFGLDYTFILARLPGLVGLGGGSGGFLQGAILTLFICVVSISASTVLALVAALARLSKSGTAFGLATFYISFFRGTPLLLQVLLIYLGLPQLGLVLDAVPAGIIALSLCYGAYMAEIFRAGIEGIDRGQWDGARSLGFAHPAILRLVVLPQAIRLIIPPTGNQFIAMLKDSSLVSVMGVWELMYLSRAYGRAEFKYMEMLISAALIYWALSAIFEILQARLEKHYGRGLRP